VPNQGVFPLKPFRQEKSHHKVAFFLSRKNYFFAGSEAAAAGAASEAAAAGADASAAGADGAATGAGATTGAGAAAGAASSFLPQAAKAAAAITAARTSDFWKLSKQHAAQTQTKSIRSLFA
jgi:hypothetical protein